MPGVWTRGEVESLADPRSFLRGVGYQRGGRVETMTVTTARFHRNRPVIGIAGVETMNDAEALAGRELRVPIDRLAALPPDTFYRHDLIGCEVATRDGRRVGVVRDVEGTLTIRGTVKPITLPVTYLGEVIDPWGKTRAGCETEITINRKDFGLNWNAVLEAGGFVVGDEVKIAVSIQAVAQ